jgi:signal transduction histidine kinase
VTAELASLPVTARRVQRRVAAPGGSARAIVAWAAGAAGLAFGLVACALSAPAQPSPWWLWAAPRLLAAGMIVAGARRWARSAAASPLLGQLLVATGSTAYLADLRVSHHRLLFGIGFCLAYLHTAFGAHLGLALPDGRVRGFGRVLVPVTYLSAVLPQTVKFFAHRPRRATAELVLSRDVSTLSEVGSVTAVLVGLAVAGMLTRRMMTATTLLRRSYAPAWVAIILWSLLCVSVAAAALVRLPALAELWLVVTTFLLWLATVAAAYRWTRAQDRRSRWRLAAIALELERTVEAGSRPPRLEQALAAAVGDPTLRLAYQLDVDRWVDIDGRPTAAVPNAGQLATPVRRNGRTVAMIIHDAMLRKKPELARVAAAAAGVAIEKVHLYATLRDQVSQIRRSRQRLATATIEERRRIQRDLHDGAQQRLFAASALLDLARTQLEQSTCDDVATGAVRRAQSQLTDAVRELRELTFGIYPEALAGQGLSGALQALADRAPIPVRLDIAADRWPRPIEFTAYLVVAEALTNVYKHAGAGAAAVTVAQHADRLVVSISDDGHGGATVGGGTGLGGLLDRVGAVGGTLEIESTVGAGTRLRTEIPLESG